MSIDPLLQRRLACLGQIGSPLDTPHEVAQLLRCCAELSEARREARGVAVERFGAFPGLPVRARAMEQALANRAQLTVPPIRLLQR